MQTGVLEGAVGHVGAPGGPIWARLMQAAASQGCVEGVDAPGEYPELLKHFLYGFFDAVTMEVFCDDAAVRAEEEDGRIAEDLILVDQFM